MHEREYVQYDTTIPEYNQNIFFSLDTPNLNLLKKYINYTYTYMWYIHNSIFFDKIRW